MNCANSNDRKRISRPKSTLLLLTFVLSALFIFAVLADAQPPNSNARPKSQPVKALVVAVYKDRIYPPTATISDRKIMLIVENRDGLRPQEFTFDRLGPNEQLIGQSKHDQAKANAKRWVTFLDLQPGRYRLTAGGQITRTFVLTVQ